MTKIIKNKTKEQYDLKYRRCKNKLFSFSKEEVSNFSKQFKTEDENALLKGHTWWLIDDRYYIAPKASSRIIVASSFVLIAALGGGGFGIYKNFFSVKKTTAEVSDSAKQVVDIIVEKGKEPTIGQEFTAQIEVKKDETKENTYLPVKLSKVTTGGIEVPPQDVSFAKNSNNQLNVINEQDNYYTYTLENDNKDAKLFIKKVLGPIQIEFKTVSQKKIDFKSDPKMFEYCVGEKFSLDGIKIVVETDDGNSFIAKNYSSSIPEGHVFTEDEAGLAKQVVITYKNDSKTYSSLNVYNNACRVSSNDDLIATLRKPDNNKIILLDPITSGGSYCIANNFDVGSNQNLTLIGSNGASNKTKYKVGWDNCPSGAESCGEYNYAGSNVRFKNIEFDNSESLDCGRSGFINAASLEFSNCTFNRNFDFWGIGDVTFNNCEFRTLFEERGKKGDEYLLTTYSGAKFVFNNCSFQGYDRALNLFRDLQELYTVEVNNCAFTSKIVNKVVFNIKDNPGVDGYYCKLLISDDTTWNGFGKCEGKPEPYVSNNPLYNSLSKGNTTSLTEVYFGDTCLWKNGKEQNPAPEPDLTK